MSVVGVGMRSHAGVALKMFEILAHENIAIQLISTSEIKISCVIDAKYAELAVRALHDGFELRETQLAVTRRFAMQNAATTGVSQRAVRRLER